MIVSRFRCPEVHEAARYFLQYINTGITDAAHHRLGRVSRNKRQPLLLHAGANLEKQTRHRSDTLTPIGFKFPPAATSDSVASLGCGICNPASQTSDYGVRVVPTTSGERINPFSHII